MEIEISDELANKVLNPEHPIIQRFRERAPGTFQHSEAVSRLCEKIGRELKLDLNALKIIGLYHDIGKMRFPQYFCENQAKGNNIHDQLDPYVSYRYITGHVADSISIIVTKIPEIPVELTRCIATHHGNSLLQSICNKLPTDTKIDYDTFRYPYSKPQDVYSCVLMICDCVEATTKAMASNGKNDHDDFDLVISSTIDRLAKEEQIDELKIREVRIITDILLSEYSAINHNRITAGYEDEKD